MSFWIVVRQGPSGVEHVVPLQASTEREAERELAEWLTAAGRGGQLALYDCDPSKLSEFDGRPALRTKSIYATDRPKKGITQRQLPAISKVETRELKKATEERRKLQQAYRESKDRAWREPTWANLYRAWHFALRHSLDGGMWLLESPDLVDVPVRSPENQRICGPDDPAIDWWPIHELPIRIGALRKHGAAVELFYDGFKQRAGVLATARLLDDFRDDAEVRAAVWIGAFLWDLTHEKACPGPSAMKTPLARELLRAVMGRIHDADGETWHHAASSVLPCTPFTGSLSDIIAPTTYDHYAHLAAVHFVWTRRLFQVVRVFHSESEIQAVGPSGA
jgi:hypothetical protein